MCQTTTVPSSIVSERRGIVITSTFAGISAVGFASSVFVSLGVDFSSFTSVVAFAPPPIKPEISSPSFPMIAKTSSTFVDTPSATP